MSAGGEAKSVGTGPSCVAQGAIGDLVALRVVEHDDRAQLRQLGSDWSERVTAGRVGDQHAGPGLAELVQQELTLEVGVQRHLCGSGFRHAVEQLEQFGPVGRQRGDPFTRADAECGEARRDSIRALVHLRVRVAVVVHRAADPVRVSLAARARSRSANYVIGHLKNNYSGDMGEAVVRN